MVMCVIQTDGRKKKGEHGDDDDNDDYSGNKDVVDDDDEKVSSMYRLHAHPHLNFLSTGQGASKRRSR